MTKTITENKNIDKMHFSYYLVRFFVILALFFTIAFGLNTIADKLEKSNKSLGIDSAKNDLNSSRFILMKAYINDVKRSKLFESDFMIQRESREPPKSVMKRDVSRNSQYGYENDRDFLLNRAYDLASKDKKWNYSSQSSIRRNRRDRGDRLSDLDQRDNYYSKKLSKTTKLSASAKNYDMARYFDPYNYDRSKDYLFKSSDDYKYRPEKYSKAYSQDYEPSYKSNPDRDQYIKKDYARSFNYDRQSSYLPERKPLPAYMSLDKLERDREPYIKEGYDDLYKYDRQYSYEPRRYSLNYPRFTSRQDNDKDFNKYYTPNRPIYNSHKRPMPASYPPERPSTFQLPSYQPRTFFPPQKSFALSFPSFYPQAPAPGRYPMQSQPSRLHSPKPPSPYPPMLPPPMYPFNNPFMPDRPNQMPFMSNIYQTSDDKLNSDEEPTKIKTLSVSIKTNNKDTSAESESSNANLLNTDVSNSQETDENDKKSIDETKNIDDTQSLISTSSPLSKSDIDIPDKDQYLDYNTITTAGLLLRRKN